MCAVILRCRVGCEEFHAEIWPLVEQINTEEMLPQGGLHMIPFEACLKVPHSLNKQTVIDASCSHWICDQNQHWQTITTNISLISDDFSNVIRPLFVIESTDNNCSRFEGV